MVDQMRRGDRLLFLQRFRRSRLSEMPRGRLPGSQMWIGTMFTAMDRDFRQAVAFAAARRLKVGSPTIAYRV